MTGKKYLTLENVSAGGLIIWGLFIANPNVDSFTKNPKLYAPMVNFTEYEIIWGAIYILCGITGIAAWFSRFHKLSPLIIGTGYLSIAVLFFLGDNESVGWAFFGFFGLSNLAHWGFGWKLATDSNG